MGNFKINITRGNLKEETYYYLKNEGIESFYRFEKGKLVPVEEKSLNYRDYRSFGMNPLEGNELENLLKKFRK